MMISQEETNWQFLFLVSVRLPRARRPQGLLIQHPARIGRLC